MHCTGPLCSCDSSMQNECFLFKLQAPGSHNHTDFAAYSSFILLESTLGLINDYDTLTFAGSKLDVQYFFVTLRNPWLPF